MCLVYIKLLSKRVILIERMSNMTQLRNYLADQVDQNVQQNHSKIFVEYVLGEMIIITHVP